MVCILYFLSMTRKRGVIDVCCFFHCPNSMSIFCKQSIPLFVCKTVLYFSTLSFASSNLSPQEDISVLFIVFIVSLDLEEEAFFTISSESNAEVCIVVNCSLRTFPLSLGQCIKIVQCVTSIINKNKIIKWPGIKINVCVIKWRMSVIGIYMQSCAQIDLYSLTSDGISSVHKFIQPKKKGKKANLINDNINWQKTEKNGTNRSHQLLRGGKRKCVCIIKREKNTQQSNMFLFLSLLYRRTLLFFNCF